MSANRKRGLGCGNRAALVWLTGILRRRMAWGKNTMTLSQPPEPLDPTWRAHQDASCALCRDGQLRFSEDSSRPIPILAMPAFQREPASTAILTAPLLS